MCPSPHPQEEMGIGTAGNFAWPRRRWSPARSSEPLGLIQIFTMQKREVPSPVTDQERRIEGSEQPGEGLNFRFGVLSIVPTSQLRADQPPHAGPPSPRPELGTQITVTPLPSAKAQSAYLPMLLFIISPAPLLPSIWAQGYLLLW